MTKQSEVTAPPATILGDSYDVAIGLRRLLAGAKHSQPITSVASQVMADVHHRARWRPRRRPAIVWVRVAASDAWTRPSD
jgi:hypothetical protein